MTLQPRHTIPIVSVIALIAALSSPVFAQDAMSSDAMSSDSMAPDAMGGDAMSPDAMGGDAMATDAMGGDAMATDAMAAPMGDAMMGGGKTIMVTIENLLSTPRRSTPWARPPRKRSPPSPRAAMSGCSRSVPR